MSFDVAGQTFELALDAFFFDFDGFSQPAQEATMAPKRQKKLEQKRKKREEKRRSIHKSQSVGLAQQMKAHCDAPIHRCLMTRGITSSGIGQVIFSRRMPDREIIAAFFLIDAYCLGVKDAWGKCLSVSEFNRAVDHITSCDHDIQTIDAASTRRLVEQAVAYADHLGFRPRGDYRKVSRIFGDIDPTGGKDLVEFGKDGKPMYVSGPHDTSAQSRQIVETLMTTCGPGNFDYFCVVDESDIFPDGRVVGVEDSSGAHHFDDENE